MSDQEHEQRDEETAEEREETVKDLDVPEEDAEGVTGGYKTIKLSDPG